VKANKFARIYINLKFKVKVTSWRLAATTWYFERKKCIRVESAN